MRGPRRVTGVVRVVVVGDEPLVRAGCRLAVEAGEGLAVVGEAGDERAASSLVGRIGPDVVVVHAGVEVARTIVAGGKLDGARVILFAAPGADGEPAGDLVAALRAGVRGVLPPDAPAVELRSAVRAVAAGGAYLAPSVARWVVSEVAARPQLAPGWRRLAGRLTDREREVVAAVGRGLSNEGISRRLHMSPATARTHVGRALAKLGLRHRAQLVVLAYEAGLVTRGTHDPHVHALDDHPA